MQILGNTKELANTLFSIMSIIDRTAVNPIFGNVKISSKKDQLYLSTINIESSMTKIIKCKINSEGAFTVSIRMLHDILRKIVDTEITLVYEKQEEQLKIIGKNCDFVLPTLPANNYPSFANYDVNNHFTIDSSSLSDILEKTEFAMSIEEARYNLNGVYLNSNENLITSCATDGHRLAVSTKEMKDSIPELDVIIPRKTVSEIIKFAKNSTSNLITIEYSNNIIAIKDDIGTIVSKLIDGTFPDYKDLIPDNPFKLVFNASHLSNIISRVSAVTNDMSERMKLIQVSLNTSQMQVKAASTLSYNCFAKEVINLQDFGYSYEGETMEIGFNPKYMLDICKVMEDNNISLYFKNSLSSIMVESEDKKNRFIVMPLKIPGKSNL